MCDRCERTYLLGRVGVGVVVSVIVISSLVFETKYYEIISRQKTTTNRYSLTDNSIVGAAYNA